MLLAGALSGAYLAIADTPAGVGQGRYYFTKYDSAAGQDTFASAETIIFGPGGRGGDPGGGGGGGSSPDPPSMTTEHILSLLRSPSGVGIELSCCLALGECRSRTGAT